MKKFIEENWFKMIASVGIIVASISITYFLFWLPFKKDYDFNKCLANSAENLFQQQTQINYQIEDLQKQKDQADIEANKKLEEFLKNNPEPKKDTVPTVSDGTLTGELRLKYKIAVPGVHYQWQKDRDHIFDAVRNIENQIRDLEERRNNTIVSDKKASDESCFKRYK